MADKGHILVINPGSTSTKLAVYAFNLSDATLRLENKTQIDHKLDREHPQLSIMDQLSPRQQAVEHYLESIQIKPNLIMSRGAPLAPMSGGTYTVDDAMLKDLRSGRYSNHASNLGPLISSELALKYDIPVYITDPITTDEFEPLARISGVPGFERKSRSHALNIKASTRRLCLKLEKEMSQSSWVVCHLGGGISVAALRNGRIIDVNDALLGMGPFSPERAGALPTSILLDLVYLKKHKREELEALLSKNSGLKGYLGTADLQEVEHRISSGDEEADLIFRAMVYQISKEIAAMASTLAFNLDGIILTGGMANSTRLCDMISNAVKPLASVYVEAGENELEGLAEAGLRILLGTESIKAYEADKNT